MLNQEEEEEEGNGTFWFKVQVPSVEGNRFVENRGEYPFEIFFIREMGGEFLFSEFGIARWTRVLEFRQKEGEDIFIVPSRIFVRGQKNWVKGEREREREEEGWKDLLKGDLFIGDTNLGVGNVVKGGSFIVVAPYFRFSGRILSKGGPFYYLLSIFSLGRGEKILLAKHDGGYSSFLSFFFYSGYLHLFSI